MAVAVAVAVARAVGAMVGAMVVLYVNLHEWSGQCYERAARGNGHFLRLTTYDLLLTTYYLLLIIN